jgi:primosomal replication protein N
MHAAQTMRRQASCSSAASVVSHHPQDQLIWNTFVGQQLIWTQQNLTKGSAIGVQVGFIESISACSGCFRLIQGTQIRMNDLETTVYKQQALDARPGCRVTWNHQPACFLRQQHRDLETASSHLQTAA